MSDTLVAIWIPHFGARPERLLVGFAKIVFQVAAVGALPLGCKGELQILRTKSEPSALHGAEASPISQTAVTSLKDCVLCCCMVFKDASS